jgi:hypothetical protein
MGGGWVQRTKAEAKPFWLTFRMHGEGSSAENASGRRRRGKVK